MQKKNILLQTKGHALTKYYLTPLRIEFMFEFLTLFKTPYYEKKNVHYF